MCQLRAATLNAPGIDDPGNGITYHKSSDLSSQSAVALVVTGEGLQGTTGT